MRITCFGSGNNTDLYGEMEKLGRLLQSDGYQATIVTGGGRGTGMEAAPKGAHEQNAQSERIGFLYKDREDANPYLTRTFDCRAIAREIRSKHEPEQFNEALLAYCMRLAGLLSSDGFVVAIDGGIGTLLEFVAILTALERGFLKAKSMAVLGSSPQFSEFDSLIAWAGKHHGKHFFQGKTADAVASWLKRQLPNPSEAR
jgi:predicted Rossmann-fold nucleotide-binding protein